MTIREIAALDPRGPLYDLRGQLGRRIYRMTEAAAAQGERTRDQIDSPQALVAHNARVREDFLTAIGEVPDRVVPYGLRRTGLVRENGFRIEKLLYESAPGVWISANLYVPHNRSVPGGGVLFLCGHHARGKHEPEYQAVCRTLVRAGLTVLAQDPFGQGERMGYMENGVSRMDVCTYEHDYAGFQCFLNGEASVRWFIRDAMRGVDVLAAQPEVDPEKIGVVGNSGGGLQTSMLTICDERIAASAPGTWITTRVAHLHTGGPADAEHMLPGLYTKGFDCEDMLLAAAPKPLLILAADSDFFPIEGTHRAYERASRAWKLCGREGDAHLFVDHTHHAFTPAMSVQSARFFARYLNGAQPDISLVEDDFIDPQLLWCTRSGQIATDIPGARFIHEENRDRVVQRITKRHKLPGDEERAAAYNALNAKVCGGREACTPNIRNVSTASCGTVDAQGLVLRAEPELWVYALVLRDCRDADRSLPCTFALWDDGTDALTEHLPWVYATLASGRAVVVVDTAAQGKLTPYPLRDVNPHAHYDTVFTLNNHLMQLGDDLPSLRAYCILRTLEALADFPLLDASDFAVYGCGREETAAAVTAFLSTGEASRVRVKDIILRGDMESLETLACSKYYNNDRICEKILYGLLQWADLPDLLRWHREVMGRA